MWIFFFKQIQGLLSLAGDIECNPGPQDVEKRRKTRSTKSTDYIYEDSVNNKEQQIVKNIKKKSVHFEVWCLFYI